MSTAMAGLAAFRGGATVDQRGLPEICYSRVSGRLVMIIRDEDGYLAQPEVKSDAEVNEMNAALGISKAQRTAMEIGSSFGWNVPGALPSAHEGGLRA